MEPNVAADPLNVSLLSAQAEVTHTRNGTNFIEQPGFHLSGFLIFDRARGLHPSLIRLRQGGAHVSFPHIDADPALLSLAQRVAAEDLATLGPWDGPGWPPAAPWKPTGSKTAALTTSCGSPT